MAMVELPAELFTEILTWLPVKSLLRFRCVSKSICALTDGSDFINWHLSKSSQNLNLRNKLIFPDTCYKIFCVCDVNFDMEEDSLHIENSVSYLWNAYIDSYCNGLFLLCKMEFAFTLWNPSTRWFMDLPDCSPQVSGEIFGSGLGYDDLIDEYKVVRIMIVHKQHEPNPEVQVWIFGLKSNIWRRAQNWNVNVLDYRSPGDGFFTTDGSLHWLSNPFSHTILEILAFDVRNETLSILPQPVCSINPEESVEGLISKLHVLEGNLCISYLSRYFPRQADLYIRKKDGADQFTWTPLFSVTEPLFLDYFGNVNVLGCSKRGDRILIDFGMDYMVSYNLKEKCIGKVGIDNGPIWKCPVWKCRTPILCVESLVKVSGGAKSEN